MSHTRHHAPRNLVLNCLFARANSYIGQDKGACLSLQHKGKKGFKYPFTVPRPNPNPNGITLSPNHYTTSNFGRLCTQFRLMYTRHAEYT